MKKELSLNKKQKLVDKLKNEKIEKLSINL
jgi:hypothetical protein